MLGPRRGPCETDGLNEKGVADELKIPTDSLVELVVDDTERQLLTPVLRHFLARGYNPLDADPSDQIRLESADGYVIVRSELLDHPELSATNDASARVLLSITASSIASIDLRHAVGSAITEYGGLEARGTDPLDADHTFHDQRGIQRAVLRSPR